MAKRTLLDLVQGVLSVTDGDNVNSISDTVEATQIADLVRQCYFDIIDEMELPGTGTLGNLEGLGDTDLPTVMRLPENISLVEWMKYDVRLDNTDDKVYRDIKYKDPHDFVTYTNNRSSTDTTNYKVCIVENSSPIIVDKTTGPTYWTTFDDEYIVFDSFDSNVDSTLQSSKSIFYGYKRPTFTLEDEFIADLPENLFTYLYSMAEARAFAAFKQDLNPKSERQENRARIRVQRNKWRSGRFNNEGPDYGKR
jgi:hypothetical protein